MDLAELTAEGFSNPAGVTVTVPTNDDQSYCLVATHAS